MNLELRTMLLVVALLALAGSASASDVDKYMLEMKVWIEGEHRDDPLLVVDAGEPASIAFENADGRTGWKLDVQVDPPGPGEGAPEGAIWVDFSIHQLENGQWEHLADSMIGVHEGRTGTLSVANGEGESTPQNSLVYVEVRTSRMRSGEKSR